MWAGTKHPLDLRFTNFKTSKWDRYPILGILSPNLELKNISAPHCALECELQLPFLG